MRLKKIGLAIIVAAVLSLLFFGRARAEFIYWDDEADNSKFLVTDGFVYWHDKIVEGADPQTFKALNSHYAIDAKSVFFLDIYRGGGMRSETSYVQTKLELADPKTFVALNETYAKDKNNVYCSSFDLECGGKINGADAKTFKAIDNWWGKDKQTVFFGSQKVAKADPGTFQLIAEYYAKDKNNVYYIASDGGGPDAAPTYTFYKITGAAPKSFTVLKDDYAKDGKAVYYYGHKIKQADTKTFQVVKDGFSKDAYSVFHFGDKLSGVSPKGFAVIDEEFFRNSLSIYYYSVGYSFDPCFKYKIVKGADPATFKLPAGNRNLNKLYATDKSFAYYGLWEAEDYDSCGYYNFTKMTGADIKTFVALDGNYAKDKHSVFALGLKTSFNPKTFKILYTYKYNWEGTKDNFKSIVKDDKLVYHSCSQIKGADAKTFEVISSVTDWSTTVYAKDKNNVYRWDTADWGVSCEIKTEIVEGADPKTFVVPRGN